MTFLQVISLEEGEDTQTHIDKVQERHKKFYDCQHWLPFCSQIKKCLLKGGPSPTMTTKHTNHPHPSFCRPSKSATSNKAERDRHTRHNVDNRANLSRFSEIAQLYQQYSLREEGKHRFHLHFFRCFPYPQHAFKQKYSPSLGK